MRKVFVTGVQPEPEGPIFGRVIDPVDIQKLQDYAHGHTEQITRDLLVAGAPGAQVAGFAAAVDGGLNVEVATGAVVDELGISYEGPDDATVVTMQAAHVALPRVDLIIATLAPETQALLEFKPFKQLRTQLELEAGGDPYVPTQYEVPTELHTRATISVKTGVPNAVPVAPALGANEVALWQVEVAAGQSVLAGGDLNDVRVLMRSLYQALVDIDALEATIATLVSQAALTESVQDIVGAFFSSPDSSLVVTYNDAGNVETVTLLPAYKTLLDGATASATGSTLAKRDASGDISFRNVTLTGKVPSYNALATAGQGLAPIVAVVLGDTITGSSSGTVLATPPDGIYQVDLGIFTRVAGSAGTAQLSVTYRNGAAGGFTKTETLAAINLAVAGDQQKTSFVAQIVQTGDITFSAPFSGGAGAPNVFYWITVRRIY
jgi:L-lactate utilization protein LutC